MRPGPPYGRPLRCTRLRMRLVVMAAVLATVRAGHGCSLDCRPTNVSMSVESCGLTELIHTTVCAGQCHHVVKPPAADFPPLVPRRAFTLFPSVPLPASVAGSRLHGLR